MKRYKIIIAIAAVVLLQFSCKKDLEPVVYSSLTNTNAFRTKSDAIAAVNAVYARLKGPSVGDNFDYWTVRHFALTDLTTDVGHCSYSGDPGQLSNIQWNSANGLIAEDWRQIYKLISNANNAIFNISPMTSLSQAEKDQFLAEIKFLRAVAYMDLTDAWGPVILATEKDLANPDYTKRATLTPLDQIEAFLINDLQAAANALPVNYANNSIYASNDVGRATKGAALTLLAKLYLRQHQWQKVVDLTKQVMDLKVYSLYPSYAGLFAESNQWCEENIFSVLSDANVNGTELLNHFGPSNHPVLTDRWQYYAVTWDFYNSFDAADDRKKLFFAEYTGVDKLVYKQAPSLGATPPAGVFYMQDVATAKYADPNGANTYYDGHSVNILRYADVLLSRAEAINELSGPTTECIDLINQVKGRSHAKLLVAANYNQTTLKDALLQERGWELFYEGKRRADLIRFGKYEPIVNGYLKRINKTPTIVMPRDQYFPYPLNQVNINPNLNNSGRQ
ncbi:RagB/SusD family nutrient uptake outer membrane protein [Pedobacter sp. HDW13]|uniref:RagB/SusD family nutrient uptake outer membrane protein n=1 Tax=Pedobacter sp. HDW13 TaxID=2714940 RepID=UPI001407818E|nr:RagB/SusD family nutrient uptake outer membrane protein [Pedobacter sp. HDW13]QIL38840.1 RagB/SusD family nutrient uptake outer membrane protein [Pedobacter sp. HDW13]